MRYTASNEKLEVPEGVSVEIKSRIVTVKGPRGTLVKNFRHQAVCFEKDPKGAILIRKHHGVRKEIAAIRTVRTLINNMITGVTKGYKYKMRYVYAHFPINVNIEKRTNEAGVEACEIEIRNFLGEKRARTVRLATGVTAVASTAQKDELIVTGNSIDDVSQSCASIQQSCMVKEKDIRKFLDGIFCSARGTEEE